MDDSYKVLVVDDDLNNLEILSERLSKQNYHVTTLENGEDAWSLLQENPLEYDVMLLDRKMPRLDGLELFKRMKKHPQMKRIPVIFQTAQAEKSEILESLKEGAYYYLTKPFEKNQLFAIVKTAVTDFRVYKALVSEKEQLIETLISMQEGVFTIKTLNEGYHLACLLAQLCPDIEKASIGLVELLTNAVEHGNLGITYSEKTALVEAGKWTQEINRRLLIPENREKKVTVRFERDEHTLNFLIHDQGEGFDWAKYLEVDTKRLFDIHGRGIAIANLHCFDHLEFHKNGSEVLAKIEMAP